MVGCYCRCLLSLPLSTISSLTDCASKQEHAVFTCSALKRVYRERLVAGLKHPYVIYHLHVPYSVAEERVRQRKGHYFTPALVLTCVAIFLHSAPFKSLITMQSNV